MGTEKGDQEKRGRARPALDKVTGYQETFLGSVRCICKVLRSFSLCEISQKALNWQYSVM